MNLQKLDKQQTVRKVNLTNEYRAYRWKQTHSNLKYVESLSNEIHSTGVSFIALWENLELFLNIKEKYNSDGAKEFVKRRVNEITKDIHYPFFLSLYKYDELEEITKMALQGDETAVAKLTCRYIVYSSAYGLLLELVAKVLTGFTFDVAYYELTNDKPIDYKSEVKIAHNSFSRYFTYDSEADYKFYSYKPHTEREYVLKYDISTLSNIVSEITDANIYLYDVITPSREGIIFNEADAHQALEAKIHEYDSVPLVELSNQKIEISPADLQNEIVVCVIYLDLVDGKVKTLSDEKEVTVDEISNTLKDLISKPIYIIDNVNTGLGEQVLACWIEVL